MLTNLHALVTGNQGQPLAAPQIHLALAIGYGVCVAFWAFVAVGRWRLRQLRASSPPDTTK